jgi:hypothetical protein
MFLLPSENGLYGVLLAFGLLTLLSLVKTGQVVYELTLWDTQAGIHCLEGSCRIPSSL